MVGSAKTTYPLRLFETGELQLGDSVKAFEGEFGTAIVTQIDETSVYFYRPYGITADFSYTGGVIAYTGVEQFSRPRASKATFFVYRRQELR